MPLSRRALRIVFLFAFILSAFLGALQRSPLAGFDEITHLSYIAHIQSTGDLWPRLENLRILDDTLRFSDAPSYLNHPATYYDFLAVLGPRILGNPNAILIFRLMNIVIASVGFYALLALGASLRLSKFEEYAWAVPLLLSPVLPALAGSVNNDNLAIAAGAVAVLATYRLAMTYQTNWLLIALAAMIAAGLAKLTGLLLVGGLVAGVLSYIIVTGHSSRWWLAVAAAAALIASMPYIVFWMQYGSPAPSTAGQIGLLTTVVDGCGNQKFSGTRMSFPEYSLNFVSNFIWNWVPVCAERNLLQISMLAVPIFALICAVVGAGKAARRVVRREASPIDIVIVAGFATTAVTATIHLIYSYARHINYAVIGGLPTYAFEPDAYPRYYMPLGAVVPLGYLVFLASKHGLARRIFIVAAIAGPITLEILGTPSKGEFEKFFATHRSLDIYHTSAKGGSISRP